MATAAPAHGGVTVADMEALLVFRTGPLGFAHGSGDANGINLELIQQPA